ncbi:uncharacterized protein [Narcine bancroftii]|uniref:uncharacterized protein n=1 Tax=Narcine bancroftii TaxID=1343680 RepID=UPI003831FC9B
MEPPSTESSSQEPEGEGPACCLQPEASQDEQQLRAGGKGVGQGQQQARGLARGKRKRWGKEVGEPSTRPKEEEDVEAGPCSQMGAESGSNRRKRPKLEGSECDQRPGPEAEEGHKHPKQKRGPKQQVCSRRPREPSTVLKRTYGYTHVDGLLEATWGQEAELPAKRLASAPQPLQKAARMHLKVGRGRAAGPQHQALGCQPACLADAQTQTEPACHWPDASTSESSPASGSSSSSAPHSQASSSSGSTSQLSVAQACPQDRSPVASCHAGLQAPKQAGTRPRGFDLSPGRRRITRQQRRPSLPISYRPEACTECWHRRDVPMATDCSSQDHWSCLIF